MPRFLISDQSASDLTIGMAKAFHNAGVQVHLITGQTVPPLIEEDGIVVEKIRAYDKSSSLRRIRTWLAGTWDIFKVFRKNKEAELFIISNPPLAPLLPLILKNEFSLLVWDIWPDALIHTKTLSDKNPLVHCWKFLNRRIFPRAKRIFTISEGLAESLTQYVPREHITVIPNWADTEFLKPLPKNENKFRQEHNLNGKFVVMYSGNIGNTHRVDALVDIAAYLRESPDIVFVIIGEGGKKELVRQRIVETGATNVVLLPYQSREMLPHSLAAADIGVITLDEAASQVSVPSKTYSMLAVGSPLLCLAGKKSELATLVRTHDVGEIFSPNCVPEISEWILSVKNDPERQADLSRKARETSLLFTPKNAEKYVAALRNK